MPEKDLIKLHVNIDLNKPDQDQNIQILSEILNSDHPVKTFSATFIKNNNNRFLSNTIFLDNNLDHAIYLIAVMMSRTEKFDQCIIQFPKQGWFSLEQEKKLIDTLLSGYCAPHFEISINNKYLNYWHLTALFSAIKFDICYTIKIALDETLLYQKIIIEVAELLRRASCKGRLQSLSLGLSRAGIDYQAVTLFEVAEIFKSGCLKSLIHLSINLSYNRIKKNIHDLLAILENAAQLRSLSIHLGFCHIKPEEFLRLLQAIHKMKALEHLELCFEHNKLNLERPELKNNNNDSHWIDLLNAILNPKLKKMWINLTENNFSHELGDFITKMFRNAVDEERCPQEMNVFLGTHYDAMLIILEQNKEQHIKRYESAQACFAFMRGFLKSENSNHGVTLPLPILEKIFAYVFPSSNLTIVSKSNKSVYLSELFAKNIVFFNSALLKKNSAEENESLKLNVK